MTSERRQPTRTPFHARQGAAFAMFAALLVGCDAPSAGVPVGSNTNWLVACDEAADCASAGTCVCGRCSLECEADADCGAIAESRCAGSVESALRSQCRSADPALAGGMCLRPCEPGGCAPGEACVGGACVTFLLPPSELCDGLPDADSPASARQDRLLDLLQALRTAGGVECDGAAQSVPVPELRWDAGLTCAARALATDMALTRNLSLIDSAGRDTRSRLALVGYAAQNWGEAFALVPGGEADALDAMLSDADSCGRLLSASFVLVGVGNAEDAYVITVGAD